MIGLYHSKDLDGIACGAIMKLRYPDITLIGVDYGEVIPENPNGEPMILCDMSYDMMDMQILAERAGGELLWIDHHATAISKFQDWTGNVEKPFDVVLQTGVAACELAWKHFFPHQQMPYAIELLGMYDTWRNTDKEKWNEEILPFQYGMRLICHTPEEFPGNLLDYLAFSPAVRALGKVLEPAINSISDIISKGKLILEYEDQQNERACKAGSFTVKFEGYRALCLNTGTHNTNVFKSVYDADKHDIMIPFTFNGKLWRYSIFSSKPGINCGALAEKHCGGGHQGAAGFRNKYLLTEFTENF